MAVTVEFFFASRAGPHTRPPFTRPPAAAERNARQAGQYTKLVACWGCERGVGAG